MKTYFDPRAPGSFGGVDALYRQLKGAKSRDEIRKWLSDQNCYTLHKPLRRKFKRNVTYANNINQQFQADLADVSKLKDHNDGVSFLLTCVDVFSKYGWVIPMKDKSAKSTKQALQQIFADRKPAKFQTDRGREFENTTVKNFFKEQGVHYFFAYNTEIKCALVERFNRTMKNKMWRYMTYKKTKRYIDVLDDLVHSYNNTYHRSIKMAPVSVNEKNIKEVWNNLYSHTFADRAKAKKVFKYKLGDFVRLSHYRHPLAKGYEEGWTEEIFVVSKQSPRVPVVYKVKDLNGEEIIGSFYEQELQKIEPPELFEIEKILSKEGRGEKTQFFVKWVDYPDSENNWVSLKEVVII